MKTEDFEMSMISGLVDKLKKYAVEYDLPPFGREIEGTKELLNQAADTIEALSAKLAAANMERSDVRYGEEKKLIEEMAEEIENCYGRETELSERARGYLLKADCSGGWISCEDRLPEEPFGCLVTIIDTNPITLEDFENILPYHVGYDGNQWNNSDGEQIPFDVIAWQPLPEPYLP